MKCCTGLVINAGLIALGIYLVVHAIRRIRHYDRLIELFKHKHSKLTELLG